MRFRYISFFVVVAITSQLLLASFLITPPRVQAATSAEERAELEQQLRELEHQIELDEAKLKEIGSTKKTLTSEVTALTTKISKLNNQIKLITSSIAKLNREIGDNNEQISITESKLSLNRRALGDAIQGLYEQEQVSLVAVLFQNANLTDFFGDLNNLLDVQASLITTVGQITLLKDDLLEQKDMLEAKKDDAARLKALQDAQKKQAASTQVEKSTLLKQTQGQEKLFQEAVAKKRADAAKIRNRIFTVLGGGQMTFEQAYNFAKIAEGGTGTPAAFLLAILNRESRLGANVGRCYYKTAMAPGPPKSKRDDVTPFLKITAELGLDPETTVVSCANADGAYGGAMGPSQFIPTTWMLYRERIAAVTGNSPANPWNNLDAFTGTALYIKDAMNRCGGGATDAGFRAAASAYYSGSCTRHAWTYGEATNVQRKQFEEDIAAITTPG